MSYRPKDFRRLERLRVAFPEFDSCELETVARKLTSILKNINEMNAAVMPHVLPTESHDPKFPS